MRSFLVFAASALVLLLREARAWPSFRFKIPNGDRVPCIDGMEACSPDGLCRGVGHTTCAGGVPSWNQFGLDLRANSAKWNRALCEKDSDGDGLANGVELGDPCCIWNYDDPSTYDLVDRTGPVSHPGSDKAAIANPQPLRCTWLTQLTLM